MESSSRRLDSIVLKGKSWRLATAGEFRPLSVSRDSVLIARDVTARCTHHHLQVKNSRSKNSQPDKPRRITSEVSNNDFQNTRQITDLQQGEI
ncbi:hypothetical protein BsWGS_07851 [Bradybaena similaris]